MGEVRVQALRGIDLTPKRGELVVLIDPSGSGKSTLLNMLGGLDAPTGGEARFVLWAGNDVLQLPTSALFRHGAGWAVFAVEGGARD